MNLLALECSSSRRSVALWRDGSVLAETFQSAGRDTRLLGMVEEVLGLAALPRETVDVVAVGLGPGSYTGIRAAIAVAQGWALATGCRLAGVSSVAACAWRCQRLGWRGRIGLVVDGQRGEFYLGRYRVTDEGAQEVEPLRLVSGGDFGRDVEEGWLLAGPDVLATGQPGRLVMPDAAAVAELAAEVVATDGGEAGMLELIYLRPTAFVRAPAPRISLPSD